MSKKHFEAIAATVRAHLSIQTQPTVISQIKGLAAGLANDFAAFNPNFDRARFLKACGVE